MTYNAHLRVLNYHTIVLTPYLHTCGLPHVKIVVFHIIKSFCPSRLPLVTHVCCLQHQSCKFVDTAAQILRNSKRQQKVHLAPVVGYMDNIYLFQFDWNYSDINPSLLFTLMLNEVIHRHVHAQKHLIWMQFFWQLKYMKPLICLKYNRSRRRRTLLRIFNPFIHGFATRVSRCPTFHPLSPVPHMSQCPTFWLAIVFRSYWHTFLKSGFCSMAVIMVMCFVFIKE